MRGSEGPSIPFAASPGIERFSNHTHRTHHLIYIPRQRRHHGLEELKGLRSQNQNSRMR